MMRDLSLVISILIVVCATTVGPFVLRKLNEAFSFKVEQLPPFPIVLRPYRSILSLYLVVGLMGLVLAIGMAILSQRNIVFLPLFGIPSLILALIGFGAAFLYSRQTITLDADKVTYRKANKVISIDFSDIKTFAVTTGYLNLVKRSDGSTAKISLYFKDIRFLSAVLKQWFGIKTL